MDFMREDENKNIDYMRDCLLRKCGPPADSIPDIYKEFEDYIVSDGYFIDEFRGEMLPDNLNDGTDAEFGLEKVSYKQYEILAERFNNGEFGIEELQSRLHTALELDRQIHHFSTRLHDLGNELELILYTNLSTDHFRLATAALDRFLEFLMKTD